MTELRYKGVPLPETLRRNLGTSEERWWRRGVDAALAVAVGRAFLETAGPEWVWRAAVVVEPHLYWCPEHRPAIAVTSTRLADVHPSVTIECVQCGRRIRRGES